MKAVTQQNPAEELRTSITQLRAQQKKVLTVTETLLSRLSTESSVQSLESFLMNNFSDPIGLAEPEPAVANNGDKQSLVMKTLGRSRMTRNEIAAKMGTFPSNISSPVNTLIRNGQIKVVSVKKNPKSGKLNEVLKIVK